MLCVSLISVLAALLPVAASQEATCIPGPLFSWSLNSQEQTPCTVAASLLAPCSGGNYGVSPLVSGGFYNGPTIAQANPCQCNTVVYSLMSACGACQNHQYASWSTWSGNCAQVTVGSYPGSLPQGVHVPAWAYFDIKSNGTFDQGAARGSTNLTESTAMSAPMNTAPDASPTSSHAPSGSSIPAAEGPTHSSKTIIIGIAGGMGGLIGFLALLGLYASCRRSSHFRGVRLSSKSEPEMASVPNTKPSVPA
ncbi:hypothetical protein BDN72DRAFT_230546 [Pluteus cervinus]|uniref:Uncharacterized protein n=1 Tax=Pluteus cervinus TaxID=181527 RepID=A0ACD3BFE1_9AGAR|nr:hypothetical protein BDN72DRAFT_230546 [Pluteus cervinus]